MDRNQLWFALWLVQLAVSRESEGGEARVKGSLVKELCVPNRFLEYNYRIIRFRFRIPHFVLSRGLGPRDVVPPPPPFVFKHHRLLRSGQITSSKRNERRDENRISSTRDKLYDFYVKCFFILRCSNILVGLERK